MCKALISVALLVFPGGRHRRPVLERISAYLRDQGLSVVVLVNSTEAELFARTWAEDLVDHFVVADTFDAAFAATAGWAVHACFSYDEFGVELASALAEKLQLPGTPSQVVREVQDKANFRQVCNCSGSLIAAKWRIHCEADLADVQGDFPKVLKPTRGGGSYWCRKISNRQELVESYAELAPQLAAATNLPAGVKAEGFVVEDYVGGDEFDVDGVVVNGEFKFTCVSDNNPALEPDFLETGGRYPSSLPEHTVQRILEVAAAVVANWPKLTSVVHFEGKVVGDEVFPLEMNMRLGGAEAPASVWAVTGVDLAKLVPMIALNKADSCLHEYLSEIGNVPKTCVRSVNVQLDPEVRIVTACGPRAGTKGPNSEPNFAGAQYYLKQGDEYRGTGSQRTVAWVAASGVTHDEADRSLEECLELCEFSGSTQFFTEDIESLDK